MRALRVLALVTLAAGTAASQPEPDALAIVVDSDAPVADTGTALLVRERALSLVERHGRAGYFNLTATSLTRVDDDQAGSFRRTPLNTQSPPYAGVSLSVGEASEILRKNEAVRDTVIHRECPSRAITDCGGAVHAAATTLLSDTEATSRGKLLRVTDLAHARGGRTLILVTAGWPSRDEGRVDLDRAVRLLRAAGTRLLVMRLPSTVPYAGTLRDASERLAARLSAPFIALGDARDEERVERALSQVAPKTAGGPSGAIPAPAAPPDPRAADESPTPAGFPDALRAASAYVTSFERTFAAVIWRERYLQEVRAARQFSASGTRFSSLIDRRQLESELFFLWLPRETSWISCDSWRPRTRASTSARCFARSRSRLWPCCSSTITTVIASRSGLTASRP